MRKLFLPIIPAFFMAVILPGADAQDVLDGVYIKEHTPTRQIIPYTHLREADVTWMKRIWRTIDLREKINHPFYYPSTKIGNRKAFFDVIKDGIMEGTITAYNALDDEFKQPLTKEEVLVTIAKVDTVYVDNETGGQDMKIVPNDVSADKVKKLWIKEDWFIDKQRSVMEVRIIGMAPLVVKESESGEEIGFTPLFWIYYPEARYLFVNAEVFNRQNDSERRTYEDILWKRMFNSYIHKESNVYDRALLEYTNGIAFQLEAEKIKDVIFTMEHDMWNY